MILPSMGAAALGEYSEEDLQDMARAKEFIGQESARIRRVDQDPGVKSEDLSLQPASTEPALDAQRWKASIADIPLDDADRIKDADRHALEAQAEADRAEARELALQGERRQAMAKLERWVEEAVPEAVKEKAMVDLVEYAFRLSDYSRSQEVLTKLLENRPKNAALVCNLAAVYLQTERYEEARILLESIEIEAIKRPALLAAVFFNRACAYSQLGRVDLAISALYTAFKAQPAATSVWLTDSQLDGIRDDPRFKMLAKGALNKKGAAPEPVLETRLSLQGAPPDEGVGTKQEAPLLTYRTR